MDSPLYIPFTEMESFARMSGVIIEVWELEIIEDLDDIRIESHGRRVRRT